MVARRVIGLGVLGSWTALGSPPVPRDEPVASLKARLPNFLPRGVYSTGSKDSLCPETSSRNARSLQETFLRTAFLIFYPHLAVVGQYYFAHLLIYMGLASDNRSVG